MIDFDRFSSNLRSARGRRDLAEAMVQAVSGIGIEFSYGTASIFDTTHVECLSSGGISAGAIRAHDCGEMELVIGRAATERLPFFWWALADVPAGTGTAQFRTPSPAGWAVPVHDGTGCIAAISFSASRGDALKIAIERHKAMLHVMAIHFHVRARALPAAGRLAASPRLTPREAQCLEGVAQGRSRTEIGLSLGISPRTIKFHLESAQRRFKVASTTQAIVCAALLGLISPELDPDSGAADP